MQVRLSKQVAESVEAEVKLQNDCNSNPKSVIKTGKVSASSLVDFIVWKYFEDKMVEKYHQKIKK